MADTKLVDLTAFTGTPNDSDVMYLVDISEPAFNDRHRKITWGTMKTALQSSGEFVLAAGDTMTGDLYVSANVGVQTTSPQAPFHLVGDEGAVTVFPTIGGKDYFVYENNHNCNMALIGGATYGTAIKFFVDGATKYGGLINYELSDNRMALGTNGITSSAAGIYIDENNNVRISGGTATGLPSHSLSIRVEDAGTNDILEVMDIARRSTGTPAGGFGVAILAEGESTTTLERDMGRLAWKWTTATDASRAAEGFISAFYTGTERKPLQFAADSAESKIGFLDTTPAAQQGHVTDPSGGSTIDAEARTAINSILATLETFGFHATS